MALDAFSTIVRLGWKKLFIGSPLASTAFFLEETTKVVN